LPPDARSPSRLPRSRDRVGAEDEADRLGDRARADRASDAERGSERSCPCPERALPIRADAGHARHARPARPLLRPRPDETITAMDPAGPTMNGQSLWPRVAGLPLVIEACEYDRLHAVL